MKLKAGHREDAQLSPPSLVLHLTVGWAWSVVGEAGFR